MSDFWGLVSWVVFGALVGWIASKIAGTDSQQGWIANIVLGIGGAIVGGLIWGVFSDTGGVAKWTVGGFILSLIGAFILSWGYAYFMGRKRV